MTRRPFFGLYVLHGHKPVLVRDTLTWARQFGGLENQVALDVIPAMPCPVTISTVFLGIDHNHSGKGPPRLFETMVFAAAEDQAGPDSSDYGPPDIADTFGRYATWEEAEAGHAAIVMRVRSLLKDGKITLPEGETRPSEQLAELLKMILNGE